MDFVNKRSLEDATELLSQIIVIDSVNKVKGLFYDLLSKAIGNINFREVVIALRGE
jgi:hypothetical protein